MKIFFIGEIYYSALCLESMLNEGIQIDEVFNVIHEIKWLVGNKVYFDLDLAVEIHQNKPHIRQFVQPLNMGSEDRVTTRLYLEEALGLVKAYPMIFRLSPQMHKFLNIP